MQVFDDQNFTKFTVEKIKILGSVAMLPLSHLVPWGGHTRLRERGRGEPIRTGDSHSGTLGTV
jgi:hypothetical protein